MTDHQPAISPSTAAHTLPVVHHDNKPSHNANHNASDNVNPATPTATPDPPTDLPVRSPVTNKTAPKTEHADAGAGADVDGDISMTSDAPATNGNGGEHTEESSKTKADPETKIETQEDKTESQSDEKENRKEPAEVEQPAPAPAPAASDSPSTTPVNRAESAPETKPPPPLPLSDQPAPSASAPQPTGPQTPAPKTNSKTNAKSSAKSSAKSAEPVVFTSTAATSGPITKLQNRFLVRCVQGLKRVNDSRFYKEPVDPVKLNIPSYFSIITQPMDLGTIESKLKQGFYDNVDAVVADFNLMVENAVTFNGPDHPVAIEGQNLRRSFYRHMGKLPGVDEVEPSPAEKKSAPKKAAQPKSTPQPRRDSRAGSAARARGSSVTSPHGQTFALGPEGLPLIRRDSTSVDGRPKRSIHPPKNRDLPYSTKPRKKKFALELKFCQEALDELHKPKHYSFAAPFYQPVDPVALNIPNYHSIIKNPMDLGTVQQKLKNNQYENAKEFEADIRLMFKNCYKFNISGDPTYTCGAKLEEVFDRKWEQKGKWLEAHEPTPSAQPQSEESDIGSEASESEQEDDDSQRLLELQKQVASMSKQIEMITSKKKKKSSKSVSAHGSSSHGASASHGGAAANNNKRKASKTATKSSVGPAPKKQATGGGGSSASKSKKPAAAPKSKEKTRWVTYQEKQYISNGFSSLPEKRMNEALRIIQNKVPSLMDTGEGEIELEIDELPNDVLLMLLKFIKKHAPNTMMMDLDEPEPAAPAVPPPKPRKNKPMNAYEQEAQINRLENRLSEFKGIGGQGDGEKSRDQAVRSIETGDSSGNDDDSDDDDDDDEDSEESEEE